MDLAWAGDRVNVMFCVKQSIDIPRAIMGYKYVTTGFYCHSLNTPQELKNITNDERISRMFC
jgi:hypothetical protein